MHKAEHQRSDKFVSTKGCFSICLQQKNMETFNDKFKKEKEVHQVSVQDIGD